MAKIIFSGELAQLSGDREAEVEAQTVRALVRELESRYPALAGKLTGYAIAIDGVIIHTPLLERIEASSEVHFLHPIEGG